MECLICKSTTSRVVWIALNSPAPVRERAIYVLQALLPVFLSVLFVFSKLCALELVFQSCDLVLGELLHFQCHQTGSKARDFDSNDPLSQVTLSFSIYMKHFSIIGSPKQNFLGATDLILLLCSLFLALEIALMFSKKCYQCTKKCFCVLNAAWFMFLQLIWTCKNEGCTLVRMHVFILIW